MKTKKSTIEKRTFNVSFRVTEKEKEKIYKKKSLTNLKNNEFFLKAIEGNIIFNTEDISKLILELNRIGVNLNQISKKLNSEEQIGILKKINLNKQIKKNSLNLDETLEKIAKHF